MMIKKVLNEIGKLIMKMRNELMKRTAVIYFSLEGNTQFVAEIIAQKMQADIFVIQAQKTYHTQGFKKFFWGGKSVVFNERPLIEPLDFIAEQYERIFIGTPIWVGTMAPPVKSFCYQYQFTGKEVQLFCTHGGGKFVKFSQEVQKILPDNDFGTVFAQREPLILHQEQQAQQACEQWLQQIEN